MPYADYTFYTEVFGGKVPVEDIEPLLSRASDEIDALTFARIHAVTWEKLTERQKCLISRACCAQAEFLFDNSEAVDTAMSSYSINGVSMTFGNAALYEVWNGTAVSNRAMALLKQTGLTSLMAYPPEVDRALA